MIKRKYVKIDAELYRYAIDYLLYLNTYADGQSTFFREKLTEAAVSEQDKNIAKIIAEMFETVKKASNGCLSALHDGES